MDRSYISISIRFLGLLFGCEALFAFVKVIFSVVGCFMGMSAVGISPVYLVFGGIISRGILTILIAVYFLFFGRFVYQIINKQFDKRFAESGEGEFSYLLISMLGVWFAIKVVFSLYGLANYLIVRWYILSQNISATVDFPDVELTAQKLTDISNEGLVKFCVSIIISLFLSYYLVFKGKLLLKLFNVLIRFQPCNKK